MDITLSGRGQFTLNRGFLEHLGVKPGEQVSIVTLPRNRTRGVLLIDKRGCLLFSVITRPPSRTNLLVQISQAGTAMASSVSGMK
jgi:hypothetical protein